MLLAHFRQRDRPWRVLCHRELMALGAAERDSATNINVSTSRVGGNEINGDVYSLSILLTFSIRITFFLFPLFFLDFLSLMLVTSG
jgi:Na+/serine symporter